MPDCAAPPTSRLLRELEAVAADFGALIVGRSYSRLTVEVPIQPNSGGRARDRFLIDIDDVGGELQAREATRDGAGHLPKFCPERHINGDGTFCLFWSEERVVPEDRERALTWFGVLERFLRSQLVAKRFRRWPQGRGRAHGIAAKHQVAAEKLAEAISGDFAAAWVSGEVRIRRLGNGYQLLRQGQVIARLRDGRRDIATLRRACPFCPRPSKGARLLRNCADHRTQLRNIIVEMVAWKKEEKAFNRRLKGVSCCGTLKFCPLRNS